ncbi:guanylate kinase [[Clostridium] ultunense Esp]|nr:guanylate kinase [[Clostridium] ultunense Esp]
MTQEETGLLFVISGPSGVGKGTVGAALRKKNKKVVYSVSATSRSPRPGEIDGETYFFKTKEEFEAMIEAGEFLEWAQYIHHYYGTPKKFVFEQLEMGNDVFLEIEVQGAMQVKKSYPHGIFIFLLPPDMEELRQRIKNRGTEDDEVIARRLSVAREEIEMMRNYDYVVVNDQVDLAVSRIEAIITAEHCRQERTYNRYMKWFKEE